MGKVLPEIGNAEKEFIASQKVFFVGTAPLNKEHRVNISPKAAGTSVVVLGPHRVAYADLSGSGAETAAHVLENQRMTLMFCNLEEGPPKILRLYGKAEVLTKEEADDSLKKRFPEEIQSSFGFRAIYILNVDRISSSCGYSLPIMTYQRTRKTLEEFTANKGAEGMKEYCVYKNSFTIDGLPSIAHLRNQGEVIVPKPADGYIFGEKVSKDDPRASKPVAIPSRQKLDLSLIGTGAIVFLAGVLVGTLAPRARST